MGTHQKLSTFLFKKAAYKTSAQLAELWAVIEFNPIGSINPTKSGGGLKLDCFTSKKSS